MSEQAPIIAPTAPIAAKEPQKRVVSVLKRVLGSVVVTMGTKLGLAALRKAMPADNEQMMKLAEYSDLVAIGGGTLAAVAIKNEWAEAIGIGVAAGGAIEAIEKRVLPKFQKESTADPGTTGETSAQPGETDPDPFG